jgi:putative DNA-invertase from lambdoid prophage Rac
VWRLDRWGRSLPDLVSTLEELNHLGVGFVSLTEALDLTTPTGRAMAGLLSVFAAFEHEILPERVRAGLEHARQNGKQLRRQQPLQPKQPCSESYTALASVRPRSPAVSKSAERRCDVSWRLGLRAGHERAKRSV